MTEEMSVRVRLFTPIENGELAEWLKALVLKTKCGRAPHQGSNP